MTIGETVPAHKRREQQRAAAETQAWLDAGNEITRLPPNASAEKSVKANQAQRTPSRAPKADSVLTKAYDALKRLGKATYIDVANEAGMTTKQASNGLGNLVRTGRASKTGEQVQAGPGERYAPVYRAR